LCRGSTIPSPKQSVDHDIDNAKPAQANSRV
jgi:hypothetical protein